MKLPVLGKHNAKKYFSKGLKLFEEENYEAAMKLFKDAIFIDKSYSEAYNYIGHCYSEKDKDDVKAKEYYLKAINVNPLDIDAFINIADIYLFKIVDFWEYPNEINYDNFNESLKWYKLALQIDINNVRAINNLGHAYQFINDFETALFLYDKALEIEPNDESANLSKQALFIQNDMNKMVNEFDGKPISYLLNKI